MNWIHSLSARLSAAQSLSLLFGQTLSLSANKNFKLKSAAGSGGKEGPRRTSQLRGITGTISTRP
jgi:hypothetical protein